MNNRPKSPLNKSEEPQYPRIESSSFGRREFVFLVGAGVAAEGLLGCGSASEIASRSQVTQPLADPCPGEIEDVDGFEDHDGCTDWDNDEDNVPDREDRCPDDPEDFDGFQDEDGCPDPDNDRDGVPDVDDECPMDPEVFNGDRDEDGCPDRTPGVHIYPSRPLILKKVYFAHASRRLSADGRRGLKFLAETLAHNISMELVAVLGHCAVNEGSKKVKRKRSERRAQAVVNYLVKNGVERGRLLPMGFADKCLLERGTSEAAHEKNRRVMFEVLIMDGYETIRQVGCKGTERTIEIPKHLIHKVKK